MGNNTTNIVVACVLVALLAGIFGFMAAPNQEKVDLSPYNKEISQLKNDLSAKNQDLSSTQAMLDQAKLELESKTASSEVSTESEVSDSVWVNRAWKEVYSEYDSNDTFFTCDGHEFDEDEMTFDIESDDVDKEKNGDVTVSFDVEFDFSDSSDERDCKVDRSFSVFFDENDIEDSDWNEAVVTWI